jgi:hypothetical protein
MEQPSSFGSRNLRTVAAPVVTSPTTHLRPPSADITALPASRAEALRSRGDRARRTSDILVRLLLGSWCYHLAERKLCGPWELAPNRTADFLVRLLPNVRQTLAFAPSSSTPLSETRMNFATALVAGVGLPSSSRIPAFVSASRCFRKAFGARACMGLTDLPSFS